MFNDLRMTVATVIVRRQYSVCQVMPLAILLKNLRNFFMGWGRGAYVNRGAWAAALTVPLLIKLWRLKHTFCEILTTKRT